MDYEVYLPIQEVVSVWKDGRRKLRERIVLPNLLFLHLTELERKVVVALPFVKRFMVDRAGKVDAYNRHPMAVIPDGQMERFKFMLGQDEKEVSMEPLTLKTAMPSASSAAVWQVLKVMSIKAIRVSHTWP